PGAGQDAAEIENTNSSQGAGHYDFCMKLIRELESLAAGGASSFATVAASDGRRETPAYQSARRGAASRQLLSAKRRSSWPSVQAMLMWPRPNGIAASS